MKWRAQCPGCGAGALSEAFVLPRQPVVLNYRFRDAQEASRVPRRSVSLVQCRQCGLVFNATFDVAAIPYDCRYDNRQCFSSAFQSHLDKLAKRLSGSIRAQKGKILEVGCGKGDFLRLLCRTAAASGDGYDTSFESNGRPELPGVRFHRCYLNSLDVRGSYDVVVCRHVIEHVPEVGAFLRELHAIARAAGDPVVAIETPRFEWIVEQLSLWDIFYEHCNYFPAATLAHFCRRAGFRVLRHRQVFGGQYQVLELQVARRPISPCPPGIPAQARLADFARRARAHLQQMCERFTSLSGGRPWAVWGAGAKGVAFVNHLRRPRPRWVIDVNPAKQGGVLPGSRIPIIAPEQIQSLRPGFIVIANPNYAAEIKSLLKRQAYAGRVVVL